MKREISPSDLLVQYLALEPKPRTERQILSALESIAIYLANVGVSKLSSERLKAEVDAWIAKGLIKRVSDGTLVLPGHLRRFYGSARKDLDRDFDPATSSALNTAVKREVESTSSLSRITA